jgi:predicted HicB family RNase H-like nuclease
MQMSEPRQLDALDEIIHRSDQMRDSPGEDKEPVKVITVRIPKSLHTALVEEAHDRRTSMNKLATSKLRITGSTLDKVLQEQREQP